MANDRHRNLGMALETLIEYTNKVYEQKDIAVINKRPTPVKIERTWRETNRWGQTGTKVSGHLEKPSTVDFDGIYKGRAVIFEAKSTEEEKRLPLSNFAEHQIEYLRRGSRHGAISFVIVEFVAHRSFWLLTSDLVIDAWDVAKKAPKGARGVKSIPFERVQSDGYEIQNGRGAPLDYLPIVDHVFKIETAPL